MSGQQREPGTTPGTAPRTGTGADREQAAASDDGFEDALALVGRRPWQETPSGHRSPTAMDPRPSARHAPDTTTSATGSGTVSAPAPERHRATPWPEARALAARLGRGAPPRAHTVTLDRSLGHVLAEPLTALCDLPPFDTSAMDGWAVAGPGPWTVEGDGSILAGRGDAPPLRDGTAVRIATGARTPPEATAVIRSEHARTDGAQRLLYAERAVTPGQDIRPRGQECRSGDRLLPAAALVTPAVLGLAAAAGYDALAVVPQPRVEVLVLGDELLTGGLPHDGLIRDALGPMIGPWLHALGVEVIEVRRLGDDVGALHRAVIGSDADLVLTTGGTAAGPVDHVHTVLRKAGAELLVDGVAVRPGHPMLLARLPARGDADDGSRAGYLVGLPGNPLAAVSGLLTLAEPLLRGLAGRSAPAPYRAPVSEEVLGHPYDTRLVPFAHRADSLLPLRYNGPAMLRGIAAADGLAVVPPGGARPGDELEFLDLPWTPGAADFDR
ncbi:molybdopterin molybdotransferase MoeA [Streptomyces sp. NPDC004838]